MTVRAPPLEPTDDIECPACGERIPERVEICPHCDMGLH